MTFAPVKVESAHKTLRRAPHQADNGYWHRYAQVVLFCVRPDIASDFWRLC